MTSTHAMRSIEILVFDGLDELDIVAPFELLVSTARRGAARSHSGGYRGAPCRGQSHRRRLYRRDADRRRRAPAR